VTDRAEHHARQYMCLPNNLPIPKQFKRKLRCCGHLRPVQFSMI